MSDELCESRRALLQEYLQNLLQISPPKPLILNELYQFLDLPIPHRDVLQNGGKIGNENYLTGGQNNLLGDVKAGFYYNNTTGRLYVNIVQCKYKAD